MNHPTPANGSNALAIVPPAALQALRRKAALAEITAWKPEPGETLEAVIVGWREAEGPYGSQWQALVQRINGETVAIWLTSWMQGELGKQCADIGDLLSLRFHGQQTSNRGSTYNRYTLTVLKPDEVEAPAVASALKPTHP